MAKNNLTPEQDIITREFFNIVASNEDLFPQNPAMQRQLCAVIISHLLNYEVVGGKFIESGTRPARSLYNNEALDVACEWRRDHKKALEAINGPNNDTSTDEADSSEPASRPTLRQTLLRKDV
jgi:hypothetical protein